MIFTSNSDFWYSQFAGLVSLETAYPLTLGSNIGTTTTSILASFAAEGKYLKPSIQISLVHLFFNVIGILIFYPIPFMRWPIVMARKLGDITAQYRWFAVVYLALMFFILPAFIFVLSLAGPIALYSVIGPISLLLTFTSIVNALQSYRWELKCRAQCYNCFYALFTSQLTNTRLFCLVILHPGIGYVTIL